MKKQVIYEEFYSVSAPYSPEPFSVECDTPEEVGKAVLKYLEDMTDSPHLFSLTIHRGHRPVRAEP